jgi:hypothetical protein
MFYVILFETKKFWNSEKGHDLLEGFTRIVLQKLVVVVVPSQSNTLCRFIWLVGWLVHSVLIICWELREIRNRLRRLCSNSLDDIKQ